MTNNLVQIALLNLAVVIGGLVFGNFAGGGLDRETGAWSGGPIEFSVIYAIITASCGIITFFALLADPFAKGKDGIVADKQIRFSITAALIVVFLVYYSITAYWNDVETASTYFKTLLPEFMRMLGIVLAFYFGSSAAVEIWGKSAREDGQR